jgi:hypothetical protein
MPSEPLVLPTTADCHCWIFQHRLPPRKLRVYRSGILFPAGSASPFPLLCCLVRCLQGYGQASLALPGTRATICLLLSSRMGWHGMTSDSASWCRESHHYGHYTASPNPTNSYPIPIPAACHIHVDIVGPLSTSAQGCSYLFTVIDHSNR